MCSYRDFQSTNELIIQSTYSNKNLTNVTVLGKFGQILVNQTNLKRGHLFWV